MIPEYLRAARSEAFTQRGNCRECHKNCYITLCLRCSMKGVRPVRVCVKCLPDHHVWHDMAGDRSPIPGYDENIIDSRWIKAEERYASETKTNSRGILTSSS